ncbi:MAG: hypothetical protein ACI9UA_002851, partial [Pseudoalteromonas tetraodonis]
TREIDKNNRGIEQINTRINIRSLNGWLMACRRKPPERSQNPAVTVDR